MNAIRILLYLCAVSLLAGAGCRKRPAAGPARLVCQEPVYDFGTRSSVDIIEHGFLVKNMGEAPLRIKRVRSSCLCSVGELPKDAVAPGDETTVHVRMHLCGSHGHVNRKFLMESNDPYNPQTVLSVTGTVVRRVEVRPCEVSFLGPRDREALRSRRDYYVSVLLKADLSWREGLYYRVTDGADGKR